MHKSLLAGILVAALAFSGCTTADDDDPSDLYPDDPSGAGTEDLDGEHATPRTDDDDGSDMRNITGDASPEATLTASIQQGEVPVNVTFTLEATDADGDPLTWSLDLGDGTADEGTDLPASVDHAYTAAGLYNVTFAVSDGNHTVTRSIVINATAAAQGSAGDLETIVISGTISGLWAADAGYVTPPNTHTFELLSTPAQMTVVLEWGMQAIDLDLNVLTPAGSSAGSAANFNDPALGDGGNTETVEVTGESLSQLGEWSIEVYAASALEAEYTVTISFVV